ncbi:hypothetical protein TanjilG_16662 [Lupinus angustifolius]|uniref:F-box domain-containing protein n=1 Tax=Lupinus angustifolius TaxID=3871 RepID=A0A4P1QZF0_LUPAN|nr:PREDICTED: F-box/kelch-repeat protein At3g23880-like isoform X2 [Lupinus angustifolius]OIV98335.1 hypothetical protein TanjilG_16662 [Lupinus angustifolius]
MAGSEPVLMNELIEEILSWLPVKTLVQFSSVCKYWKSLLSDPYFIKLHLQRSSKHDNLILTIITPSGRDRCVTPCSIGSLLRNRYIAPEDGHLQLNCKYSVLGSCNGLVCLIGSTHENQIGQHWVRFWNPAIRLKSRKSPFLQVDLHANELGSTKFGFGYDKSSDTYKVVAVLCNRNAMEDSERTQVKVYNMGDQCWRDIQTFPAFPTNFRNGGRFLNGTLNWLAIRNYAAGCDWDTVTIDQLVIVSLDLGKETYKQLSLPVGLDEIPHFEPTIGVFRDCLYLFHDYKMTNFVVWQMKEFGVESSWTRHGSIRYQYLDVQRRIKFFSLVPLCISENGDVLLMLNHSFELIIYHPRGKRVECAKCQNKVWIDAKDHVQSLVVPY